MSKIGKKPIVVPEAVQVDVRDGQATIKGPKGEQIVKLHPAVRVLLSQKELRVTVANPENRKQRALWGTFRALLQNAVQGAVQGFERKLEVVGVGYKAAVSGQKLVLNLGYSHPIELSIPPGLEVKVEKNMITVTGANKQEVGEFAARIRSKRPPEPYKGKGVKYQDEVIRRKPGKVVKAVGAAG